jgi:hypothetical protein
MVAPARLLAKPTYHPRHVGGGLPSVLNMYARQVIRARHPRHLPRVVLALFGLPFNLVARIDRDVLPLVLVSTGVFMNQSVECSRHCFSLKGSYFEFSV